MFKQTLAAALLLVGGASADSYVSYLGCEHAPIGDENAMLKEANCLFSNSDRNEDNRLSHESYKKLIHGYL